MTSATETPLTDAILPLGAGRNQQIQHVALELAGLARQLERELAAERKAREHDRCHHGWRGSVPEEGQRIVTPCPECGAQSLFIGSGGHLTCARVPSDHGMGCPNPSVSDVVQKLKDRTERAEADLARKDKCYDELLQHNQEGEVELADLHTKDSVRTSEHNILVRENRALQGELASYKTSDKFRLTDKMLEAAAIEQRKLTDELAQCRADRDAAYEFNLEALMQAVWSSWPFVNTVMDFKEMPPEPFEAGLKAIRALKAQEPRKPFGTSGPDCEPIDYAKAMKTAREHGLPTEFPVPAPDSALPEYPTKYNCGRYDMTPSELGNWIGKLDYDLLRAKAVELERDARRYRLCRKRGSNH